MISQFSLMKRFLIDSLKNFKASTIDKDPAYKLYNTFRNTYNTKINPEYNQARKLLSKGKRNFIAGLREMNPDKQYYPDANFTMRLSYGVVDDYYPADAVHFNYFTTMDGIMQKEDPNTWEFVVPKKLKNPLRGKRFWHLRRWGYNESMFPDQS